MDVHETCRDLSWAFMKHFMGVHGTFHGRPMKTFMKHFMDVYGRS